MVVVQKGLPPELVNSAAELFLSAFATKFIPILGNNKNVIKLFSSSISVSNCFVALEANQLLGVLAIQTENQGFLPLSFEDLVAHYGFWGALAKGVVLDFLQHRPQPQELYVEGIAVVDFAQGKGIGTQLFAELAIFAQTHNFQEVTLEVIDTNRRALQLYERLGFTIQKRTKIWPINKIVGWPFSETITMVQQIG
jgi:ribosomal protein S18 acetylase RimI-like enzyme